jgi:spore coat-associated protein S
VRQKDNVDRIPELNSKNLINKGVVILSLIDQEPLKEVLENYDYKVLDTINENYKEKKGVWWVKTSIGDKILKKVSFSEQTIKYILSAVDHLTHNGVLIPNVNKTSAGSDYVKIDDICFILTDAIKGINPRYDYPEELEAVVKELAKFHKASAGFKAPEGLNPKDHLGTWVEDYTIVLEDMNELYKKVVLAEDKTPIDDIVIREFPYFLERGQKAIDGLKGQEYQNWVDKIREIGCLCHQDFAAGNLILTPSGLYVIDTDSITFDIPARDIRKLFNKIMKKSGRGNSGLVKNIIDYYQSVYPLTYDEWQVVKYDLMFPHLFLGAMSKYCNQIEESWTTGKYMEKLREMVYIEKTMAPIYDDLNLLLKI